MTAPIDCPEIAAMVAEAEAGGADLEALAARLVAERDPVDFLAAALRAAAPGAAVDVESIARAALVVRPGSAAAAQRALPEVDAADLFGACPVVLGRVRDIAEQRRVPVDFPALGVLALASIACADRLRGQVPQPGGRPWRFPPHVLAFLAASSGGAKSAAKRDVGFDEIAAWERWLEQQTEDEVARDAAERSAATRALPKCKADEALEHHKRLARPKVATPQPRVADITPEQLVRQGHRSGFLAVVADEGKVFLDRFVRGDGGEQVDALLAMISGEEYHRGRVSDDREGVGRPRFPDLHGAGLLLTQPSVLRPVDDDDRARLVAVAERGLWARCILALPRDVTRDEVLAEPVLDPAAEDRRDQYDALVRRLLRTRTGNHPLAPRRVVREDDGTFVTLYDGWSAIFDDDAAAEVLAFQRAWRAEAAAGGRYHGDKHRAPLAARLGERAAVTATLLAVLRSGRIAGDLRVTLDDVGRACRFAAGYVWPHAEAVLERAGATPVEALAADLYRYLCEHGPTTKRDLYRGPFKGAEVKKASETRTPLDAAAEYLARRGMVELSEGKRKQVTLAPLIGHPLARSDKEAA